MRAVELMEFPSTKAERIMVRFSVLSFLRVSLCLSGQAMSMQLLMIY
jgi:hypothetical protein